MSSHAPHLRTALAFTVFHALVVVPVRARAADATSSVEAARAAPRTDASSRKISIRVRSADVPLHVELQGEDARESPRLECRTPCLARLEPGGKIRLWVHDAESTKTWYRVVRVNGSSEVTFARPAAGATRTVGFALGIGGVVAFLAGFVLLAPGGCDGGCEPRDPALTVAGASLLLGGLVMAPVGGILILMSHEPDVDVRPLPTSRAVRGSGPSLGAGWKLGFRF